MVNNRSAPRSMVIVGNQRFAIRSVLEKIHKKNENNLAWFLVSGVLFPRGSPAILLAIFGAPGRNDYHPSEGL
jgi:hypothetical protein